MAHHRLRVVPHGAGTVEWRLEAPAVTPQKIVSALLLGLLLLTVPAACLGAGWWRSLLLGAGGASVLVVLRALFEVHHESLTYLRLMGVQLSSQRRCRMWGSTRFLPLRHIQGIIIHEEVTATSVHFYIGLSLKPAAQQQLEDEEEEERRQQAEGGSSGKADGGSMANGGTAGGRQPPPPLNLGSSSGGIGDGQEGEVVIVFPTLRPRPSLSQLRQVYQQLQPLLQTDLDCYQAEALSPDADPAEEPRAWDADTDTDK